MPRSAPRGSSVGKPTIASLTAERDELRRDLALIADRLLDAAEEHELCAEYDVFVNEVNSDLKSKKWLHDRNVEVKRTVSITITGLPRGEEGSLDAIDHLLASRVTKWAYDEYSVDAMVRVELLEALSDES